MDEAKIERPRVVLAARCIIANENNELLLLRRSSSDVYNSGLWEFPGGKLDSGQDVSEALRREAQEETGLHVNPSLPLYCTESYMLEDGKYEGLVYVGLFGLARAINDRVKLSHEHEKSRWVPMEHMNDLDLTDETINAVQVLGKTVLRSFLGK